MSDDRSGLPLPWLCRDERRSQWTSLDGYGAVVGIAAVADDPLVGAGRRCEIAVRRRVSAVASDRVGLAVDHGIAVGAMRVKVIVPVGLKPSVSVAESVSLVPPLPPVAPADVISDGSARLTVSDAREPNSNIVPKPPEPPA